MIYRGANVNTVSTCTSMYNYLLLLVHYILCCFSILNENRFFFYKTMPIIILIK